MGKMSKLKELLFKERRISHWEKYKEILNLDDFTAAWGDDNVL